MNNSINSIAGHGIPICGNDIDTDRIIPARFMRCVSFKGLGSYAFFDQRFNEDGSEKNHPFNEKNYKNNNILIVNKNFGCGSSREHAPQSLMDFGINAVIGESFAEIFAGNCTAMGIPAVIVKQKDINSIMEITQNNPEENIKIDLENKILILGDKNFKLDMPENYRKALISGNWDSTNSLLNNKTYIEDKLEEVPYISNFQ